MRERGSIFKRNGSSDGGRLQEREGLSGRGLIREKVLSEHGLSGPIYVFTTSCKRAAEFCKEISRSQLALGNSEGGGRDCQRRNLIGEREGLV